MRRDMDLCRTILQQIEASETSPCEWIDLKIDGKSDRDVSYQVKLLDEAGLIEAIDLSTDDGFEVCPKRLTWAGHEFLDAVRDDTIWRRAKTLAKEKSGGLAFDLIKEIAKRLAVAAIFTG